MTILPKQKAAGTAPKKSVNRDGNHSRDITHERQVFDITFPFRLIGFARVHVDDVITYASENYFFSSKILS